VSDFDVFHVMIIYFIFTTNILPPALPLTFNNQINSTLDPRSVLPGRFAPGLGGNSQVAPEIG